MALPKMSKRPQFAAYQFLWGAVDWVFPPSCAGCGKFGERWCADCQQKAIRLVGDLCPICGSPVDVPGPCSACQRQHSDLDALRSWCIFDGPPREALHRLKYQRDISIGEALSRPMIDLVQQLNWPIDWVSCIPLSAGRLSERGYNQSSLLARPIALALGKPFSANLVSRTRETKSQVGLSASERKDNVAGAFSAQRQAVKGKTILLVDDVMTTGATMNSCARALKESGANSVFGLTFARAVLQEQKNHLLSFFA